MLFYADIDGNKLLEGWTFTKVNLSKVNTFVVNLFEYYQFEDMRWFLKIQGKENGSYEIRSKNKSVEDMLKNKYPDLRINFWYD